MIIKFEVTLTETELTNDPAQVVGLRRTDNALSVQQDLHLVLPAQLLVEEAVLAVGLIPVGAVEPITVSVLQLETLRGGDEGVAGDRQLTLLEAVGGVGGSVELPLETLHTLGQEVTGVHTGGAVVTELSSPAVITSAQPTLTLPVSAAELILLPETLTDGLVTVTGRARPPRLALTAPAVAEAVRATESSGPVPVTGHVVTLTHRPVYPHVPLPFLAHTLPALAHSPAAAERSSSRRSAGEVRVPGVSVVTRTLALGPEVSVRRVRSVEALTLPADQVA